MLVERISPTNLSELLEGAAGSTKYAKKVLALPEPSPSCMRQQVHVQGNPAQLTVTLTTLLNPRTVLRIGHMAIAVGPAATVTVLHESHDLVHVVLDDAAPVRVVARALTAELGGRSRGRLLLGRCSLVCWSLFNRVTEHYVLVADHDVENVAADLLGASETRVAVR